MRSIRTKMTLLTVVAIIIALAAATVLGVAAIRSIGKSSSERLLRLLCEAGEKNLDSYFESIEQSVEMVSAYVESDLTGLDSERLAKHIENAKDIFAKMSLQAHGVETYYYRIDPAVSQTEKGFWFVDLDGEGFREHEVTDITLYDTSDTSSLVWFTVPKYTGKAVWLPPYVTDNLDVLVLSYNVPVYFEGTFVGVIGIELDYSTMAEQVDSITLYDNGYAFINDAEGNIVYHPRMDVTAMENPPKTPVGMLDENNFIQYTFDGVKKEAVWLELENGMRLNVTVPVSEINSGWHRWIYEILIVSVVLLAGFILITMRLTGQITTPLTRLTEIAEKVNEGEYDHKLEYNKNDEVGILTQAFNNLTSHLKTYIGDLNDLAYADALTSLHNKGAFDICVQNIELRLEGEEGRFEFAVCIFDCNDLKKVNDRDGHDKGDIYLKETAAIICETFDHSPVFRIGGDEFAAVLLGNDYKNREELVKRFDEACMKKREASTLHWEQVDVARGMAVYDPEEDITVSDVVRRADKLMYENKWKRKQGITEN